LQLLLGVHADTIAFTTYARARGLLLDRGWTWIGAPSKYGGRDVKLAGSPPRRFHMRLTGQRESGKTISCQLELHDAGRLHAPLMKLELGFAPDGSNTRIRLRGSTARELTPVSSTGGTDPRGPANVYARALADQIAKAMEGPRKSPGVPKS
jgi:hypothetical protein